MTTPAPPELSVITVTHARRELVLQKGDTLSRQTIGADAFEWVVLVHEDVDGTEGALRAFASERAAFPVRIEVRGRLRSIGAARREAVAAARGPTLVFSDDDCLAAPDLLERHRACQRTAAGVWLGPVTFRSEGREDRWMPAPAWWQLNGANASLPREAYRAVDGFDEALEGYGGEDLLLGYRLHRAGVPFQACPDAAVVHVGPNPVAGADPEKARQAGANAARIAGRYPELAYRLGVTPWLMRLKALLYDAPWTPALARIGGGRFAYERAYYHGAKARREARSP